MFIKTPYGRFENLIDAANYTAQHHGVHFIVEHQQYVKDFPFAAWKGTFGIGNNNATKFFVYIILRDKLLDKTPEWTSVKQPLVAA